ncbi:MAG: SEC-C domain-containing protein [Candidatus Nealsonbacteria bacterium]|nr:SEC-C domain-containing protein [Candidatus Nealsonbacteria bacterium]
MESPHLDQPIAGTDHNCGKSVGRNSKCPCGSGKKFKRCCLQRESVRSTAPLSRDAFKDAVNCIWWLSPSPWPKSSNRRVAVPYSESMKHLLKNGYRANVVRPSGHEISEKFSRDHGSAIPPNLIAVPNTESNSYYLRYCKAIGLPPHPARFPSAIPEYFIRMLTDIGDTVVDPFAGSCVTGEVAERLKRKWICCDLVEEYLHGALARFDEPDSEALVPRAVSPARSSGSGKSFYRVHHPGSLWEANTPDSLQEDGGQTRPQSIGNTTSQDDLHV